MKNENSYEIEIKSLLGSKENADSLILKMKKKDPALREIGSHKQLNHYFVPVGEQSLKNLYESAKSLVGGEKIEKLKELADKAKDFSVRTRWADGNVILVLKASVDDTTSFNGTARLEWESPVGITMEELDKLVLDSGFKYQAKWSRERSDYKYHPSDSEEISVSIDKNAGYGYLAEFEMLAEDKGLAESIKSRIREVMKELEAEELPQDRLERMFAYYNSNWPDYYGTDKIFVID